MSDRFSNTAILLIYSNMMYVVIFMFVGCAASLSLPSYIKPCRASAPDFEECCLKHGREALPHILKGDKKYHIPQVNPLSIPLINMDAGKDLHIELKDVIAYGLDKIVLELVKIDIKAKKISLRVFVPRLELNGDYDMDGKILILPIQGNGKMNMTALDGRYQYNFEYKLNKINGVEYMEMTDKGNLDFKVGKIIFQLDNLFNGDAVLGKQMNDFLNENWEEVIKEMGGAISNTIGTLGRSITSNYLKDIPYHDLLLD